MWLLRALRVAAFLTPLVPARVGYWLCALVATSLYVVKLRGRRQVLRNLRQVEPWRGWLGRQRQGYRVFKTVVMNYYDLLRLRTVDRERLFDFIHVEGQEHLDRALAQGRGVIILSGHIGNFSVVAQYPAALGHHSAIIAEQVRPPRLFHFMARLRSAMGIEVIPPGRRAIVPIRRLLRQNGLLLLAGDRDVSGHGAFVEFFGAPAKLPTGPVVLAMLTGAPLLPAYTLRQCTRHSVVRVQPPLELVRTNNRDADLRENMRRMARCLEQMISADPGQWAVLQPIWGEPSDHLRERGEGLGTVPGEVTRVIEPATGAGDQTAPSSSSSSRRIR